MPSPPPVFDAAGSFGARVREQRHSLQLSQEQLADLTGLHWTYVGSVERGRRNVSLLNILRLADALQLDAGDLLRGLTPPNTG